MQCIRKDSESHNQAQRQAVDFATSRLHFLAGGIRFRLLIENVCDGKARGTVLHVRVAETGYFAYETASISARNAEMCFFWVTAIAFSRKLPLIINRTSCKLERG